MAWIEEPIVEGCVTTRAKTSLRPGELRSASFVELRPGDRIQLHPDSGYYRMATLHKAALPTADIDRQVLGMWNLTFEESVSFLAVAYIGSAVDLGSGAPISGSLVLKVWDLSLLDGDDTLSSALAFEEQVYWTSSEVPTFRASMTPRGAEYFFAVGSFEATNFSFSRVITYDVDNGIQSREQGLDPATNITLEIGENYPTVGNAATGGLFLSEWTSPDTPNIYSFYDLLNLDLFESNYYWNESYPTKFDKQKIYDLFIDAVQPNQSIAWWLPVKAVRLVSTGNAYVFGYYCTMYNSETGVESAPSDMLYNTNLSAAGAEWEVELDLQAFFEGSSNWEWDTARVDTELARPSTTPPKGTYQDLLRYIIQGGDAFTDARSRGYRWAMIWKYVFGPASEYNIEPYKDSPDFITEDRLLWYNIPDSLSQSKVAADLGENSGLYSYLFVMSGDKSPDLTLQRLKRCQELYELWKAGDVPNAITVRVPLTDRQRSQIDATISITYQERDDADKVRIYRQNLGLVPDLAAAVEYGEGVNNYTPISVPEEGDIIKLAEDIREGRAIRTGGLLEELDTTVFTPGTPYEYIDNLDESGVADPSQGYPTITRIGSQGLSVYEFLRKPGLHGIAANYGQSVIRVEPEVGGNILLASPSDAPEQSPLTYAIPVVSERQDIVTALKNIRDLLLVFTENTVFRLNYIPFESAVSQDRVLTQISAYHGCGTFQLTETVETHSGQYAVWLSKTMLAGTNGMGFFDLCPDFSVETAFNDWFDVSLAVLTNNPNKHRLELWEGNRRWDFYYHRSQMKDIRGDGSGLVFKMMGPSQWYGDNERVAAACVCELNGRLVPFHLVRSTKGGGVSFYLVREEQQDDPDAKVSRRTPSFRTRALAGHSPANNKKTKRVAAQHGDLEFLLFGIGGADGGVGQNELPATQGRAAQIDNTRGFTIMTPEEGFHSKLEYAVQWGPRELGPLWLDVEELPSGRGR